jgi:hypothetical protein
MKVLQGIAAVCMLVLLVSGCTMDGPTSGAAPTAAQQAALDALRPIVAKLVDTTTDPAALVASLTSLLQDTFGTEASQFMKSTVTPIGTPGEPKSLNGNAEDANCILRASNTEYEFPWGTIAYASAYVWQKNAQVALPIQHMRIIYTSRYQSATVNTYGATKIEFWSNWVWGWFPAIGPTEYYDAWDTVYLARGHLSIP